MEGIQMYLGGLTNDQSWAFKRWKAQEDSHFGETTTLDVLSMIIAFASAAQSRFLGEDLFGASSQTP